jgi:hypothetical protein
MMVLSSVALSFIFAGVLLSCFSQSPRRADSVVVLGGGPNEGLRYARGRQLILDSYSSRMLLINQSESVREDVLGRWTGFSVQFENQPHNTWQEAQAVRSWMLKRGLKSALIVSDPPHMLRVEYSFFSSFLGTDLDYTLIATIPPWWSAWRWWENTVSFDFVGSEVVKNVYYLLNYRFGLF